ELVTLQTQDRRQAFEILLAEQPVAPPCPLRCQETLVFEEADLRDRDVGELVGQAAHDLAVTKHPGCATDGGAHTRVTAPRRSAGTCRSAARRRSRAPGCRSVGG